MLFTKEFDYAIRTLRCLSRVEKMNVQEIAKAENMTVPITYKVTRKLEQAGYLKSYRGVNGGYALNISMDQLRLYDVVQAIDREMLITECVNHDHVCSQNPDTAPCSMHKEFCRIQGIIVGELKSRTMSAIF